ncbi:hypothetical protein [Pseudenhygromyxa sp. WMMC2535]|nr:hypothetical protein [Pseudenhygromyxa sp. WMMC2535]
MSHHAGVQVHPAAIASARADGSVLADLAGAGGAEWRREPL